MYTTVKFSSVVFSLIDLLMLLNLLFNSSLLNYSIEAIQTFRSIAGPLHHSRVFIKNVLNLYFRFVTRYSNG